MEHLLLDIVGIRAWELYGHSFVWTPGVLWPFVFSNLLIGLTYFANPIMLFTLFIFACGTTHLVNIWTLWQPVYSLSMGVDLFTGSLFTGSLFMGGLSAVVVLTIWQRLPDFLKLPSTKSLRIANEQLQATNQALETANLALNESNAALQREIEERRAAEAALRISEERARTSMENMIDAFAIFNSVRDENGEIVDFEFDYVNHAACQDLGLSRSHIVGSRLLELLPNNKDAGLYDVYRQVVETGEPSMMDEYHYEDLVDGKPFVAYYENRARKLGDGFALTWRNISDRKHADAVLEQHAQDLARSNAELEQFAYVASHDLQEPLRIVAGYVQLLTRRYQDKLDEDANEFIAFILDATERMQTMIQDLLAFSRVSTRTPSRQPVDSGAILERALANLQVAIDEAHATITHDPMPLVKSDPTQLGQIFQNLISNALKFRGEETPSIQIGAEDEGEMWRFSVADNGIGIAAEYSDRIFLVFQRLHTRDEYEGSGIGLAICRKIVEQHGGKIWLESEEGQGSTFYFTLPKATGE